MKRVISFILLLIPAVLMAQTQESTYITANQQNEVINAVLANETDKENIASLVKIIDNADEIYSSIEDKLKAGGKITVFFDPAHGKLPSGRWQGEATARLSSRGIPEEIYSIPLSRKLYRLLSANKFIQVKSTPDFMEVLEGKSETYDNITFTETIRLAEECNAFFIVASHLNNVSTDQKADGLANIKGIHVTRGGNGKLFLTDVYSVQSGFLTLFNKFDPTGFTYDIALSFKKRMIGNGFVPNNWDTGTVADDRFLYFSNFPLSLMFESAFISNPQEEAMLLDEKKQDEITKAQYDAVLDSMLQRFGIDLSESAPEAEKTPYDIVTLIKLSRIVKFYIDGAELGKAISVCGAIEKKYSKTKAENTIRSYSEIKHRLQNAAYGLESANKYLKKKKYGRACSSLKNASSALGNNPLYYQLKSSIASRYRKVSGRGMNRGLNYGDARNEDSGYDYDFANLPGGYEKHSLYTPFILTVEEGQTLKDAIDLSLAPSDAYREKVYAALNNVKISGYSTQKKWSAKSKRYVYVKVRNSRQVAFSRGIYVIQFGSKFSVVRAEKVRRVPFDPKKFQNQLYFKNSSLAEDTREKTL